MAEVPTPQEVAATFVHAYYKHLCDAPGEVHRFYRGSSMVSRPGPDGAMISFTTMDEIKKHVLSSLEDFKESDIFSTDAQPTQNSGVLVMVIGRFTTKNDETKKFNQSFVLAPMEEVHGYFVSNDVLRFLEEQDTIAMRTGDVHTGNASSKPDDVPTNDPPKKSFLSVVTKNTEPFQSMPPAPKPKVSDLSGKPSLGGKKSIGHLDDSKGACIFVGNLGADPKPEELYEAFKSFGTIKQNGILVRTDKQNRWFAFIEFESPHAAQNALQASSIIVGNRKLNIEEKKLKNESRNAKSGSIIGNGNGNGQSNVRASRKFTRSNESTSL